MNYFKTILITVRTKSHFKIVTHCAISNQRRPQAIERSFNKLKSELLNKKYLGYKKLC